MPRIKAGEKLTHLSRMSKIAIKRRFIALRKAGERERRQGFIRVARWSVCHLCYGHKLGHLGVLMLLYLVTI